MHYAKRFCKAIQLLEFNRVLALPLNWLIVTLLVSSTTQGQVVESREPPTANLLASASVPSPPRLSATSKLKPQILPKELADLEIALGRLRMVPDRFRIVRKHEHSSVDEFERTVQVSTAEGRPTLRLNYVDSSEKWSLHIDPIIGAEWTREAMVDQVPTCIRYSQPPGLPIAIEISQPGQPTKKIVGATLWHLTEQNSPEFVRFVLPAFKRLNCAWDLPAMLTAAHRIRIQCAGLEDDPCGEALKRCVNELESTDHAVRSAAVEQLRKAGLAAHIPLERMTHQTLSTQQRSTINQLLAELEPRSADTPTRLAYWLSGDPNWR